MAEVNHVDKRNSYKNLANMVPFTPIGFAYMSLEEEFYSLRLYPTHSFMWDREIMGDRTYDIIWTTVWGNEFDDNV